MPANTPLGYPYPLATDPVADGDDAIHNLATAVNNMAGVSASGIAVVNVTATNTPTNLVVTFPAGRFTAPPAVVASPASGNPSTVLATAGIATTTSVTITAFRTASAGSTQVSWIATQQP